MSNGKRVVLAGHIAGADEVRHVFTVDAAASDNDIMTFFGTWLPLAFSSTFRDMFSDRLLYERYILEAYTGGRWLYRQEQAVSLQGTKTTDALPNQSAVCVVGITASNRRGKKFFSGILEEIQNNGVLVGSFKTRFDTWGQAWTAPTTLVPGTTIVTGVCKPDSSDFIGFSTYRTDTVLATQRRRKPGVGS